ncbi:MAG: hypothetical protein QM733_24890 [Ilumatobacteraceae bacterium]
MKKCYLWIAAALFACNSHTPNTNESQTPTIAAAGKGDTIVWIGVHARWNVTPTVEYDGNYDTTHGIFVVCSSDKHAVVPRDHVVLESSSSCDTAFSNRVRLMWFRRDSSLAGTIGKGAFAEVNAAKTPTLSFTTREGGAKTIALKPTEANRLRQTIILQRQVKLVR